MCPRKGVRKINNIFEGNSISQGVEKLKEMLKQAKSTVIMTGAGMDTESNIPDFRSKTGLWGQVDPRKVAHIDALHRDYDLFHEFYFSRIDTMKGIEPHAGHYVLADLEKAGLLKSIATQNVSGLHSLAGSKNVHELHGNLQKVHCNNCYKEASFDDFYHKKPCSNCGGFLRPAVILFGENLPGEIWMAAERDIRNCDLLIVIGTSLEVYPVNQFPSIVRGKTVLINFEDVSLNHNFSLKILGKAKGVLQQLEKAL